jgi:hypothetical protein
VRCGGHYGEDVAVAHELLGGSFASVRKLINLMPDAERMILISVFFFSVCLAKEKNFGQYSVFRLEFWPR